MKQNFSPILVFLFALGILAGFTAQAQEDSPVNNEEKEIREELNNHPELNLNEDKTLISEPDQKPSSSTSTKEATHPAKVSKTKSDKAHPEKGEEDALSFNFLYYIIQKFKISDIVDN
jgi:hypothetical protein